MFFHADLVRRTSIWGLAEDANSYFGWYIDHIVCKTNVCVICRDAFKLLRSSSRKGVAMSRSIGVFAILGAIGSFIGGVATAYGALRPAPPQTAPELVAAIYQLIEAFKDNGIELPPPEAHKAIDALEALTQDISLATSDDGNNLAFIYRSTAGVRDYPGDVPFDFITPDGSSGLLMVDPYKIGQSVGFTLDGKRSGRVPIGENVELHIGNQTCRFEVLGIPDDDTARIRSRCQ